MHYAASFCTPLGAACLACQRSYCNCIPSHISGLVLNAFDSRNPISADIPARPLMIAEKAWRETHAGGSLQSAEPPALFAWATSCPPYET